MELEPGGRIGSYLLVEMIAEGGMGMVYLARDEDLRRQVAIKIVRPRYAEEEGVLRRFEREALLLARVRHPHVVTIHQLGVHGDGRFMVMEYLPGPDLSRLLLDRGGGLDLREVLGYGVQIASGLRHLHGLAEPIVHRDVKPLNLVLDAGGTVKICDLGIAVAPTSDLDRCTRAGRTPGTPAYMAPEQLRGEEAGPPADLYAFGRVLYALLAGRPPAAEPGPPPPVPDRPEVPAALTRLIEGLLAAEPADRPDADEALRALREIDASAEEPSVFGETEPATATSPPPRGDVPLAVAERLLADGDAAGAAAAFAAIARTSRVPEEACTAEFGRLRAKLALGAVSEAALRWGRLLARTRRELGEQHPLTRSVADFGETARLIR